MSQEYFAAVSPDDIGRKLFAKVEQDDKEDLVSAFYDRNRRAYLYYYGLEAPGVHATSVISRGGEQGELAELRVNHSRALVQTLLNLISAGKIVWQPVATNSDYAAAAQCALASAVLEFYWQDRRVVQFALRALEEAIAFTEGFVLALWDDSLGEDLAGYQGQIVKSGDIRFVNVSTWDVIRDPRKKSWEESDWVIVRLQKNKYDLAAQHPELESEILSVPDRLKTSRLTSGNQKLHDSDDVDCFYFFHKPTPSMPVGRETVFLSSTCVLSDGPLSYDSIPLHRVFAADLVGTPFAYSPFLEILGIQELIDSLETAVSSNQTTFAAQCIAIEQGSEIPVDQIAGGMKAIYYKPGSPPPQALQLTKSPPEVFSHIQQLKKDQEQLMGLNSVVRGEPMTGDQSGAALALLQSQAVQQSSGLQSNYLRFVEGLGNSLLEIIKRRCPTSRRISISGKASRFLQREMEYDAGSFGLVRKVMVEIGNPLAQTSAGRATMAQELIKMGVVKTAEQYQQVLSTGRVEPLTESLQNELLLIRSENEQLAEGQAPVLSPDDDHMLHVREHRAVMANPEARKNPDVLQAYMQHVEEHFQTYYNADPRRLIIMGQQPPPMPMGPPPGMGGPPAPPPPPPGGSHAGPPKGPPGPPESAPNPQNLPNMPSLPTNPSTGKQWNPVDGGGAVNPPT